MTVTYHGPLPPLTKREFFAALAMQALLARGGLGNAEANCYTALIHADKLIELLNQEEKDHGGGAKSD